MISFCARRAACSHRRHEVARLLNLVAQTTTAVVLVLDTKFSTTTTAVVSDEKLSGVLQQLGSAGKPSFAAILASKRLTVPSTVLDV